MPDATAQVRYREETKPPYDDSHGTPHTMVRRILEFELPAGKATCEQTDYGHPGRFNPWEQRHIDAKLQPRASQLLAAAEAISKLLDQ